MGIEKAAVYRDQIAAISAIPNQEKLDAFLTQVGRNRVKVVRRNAERIAQKQREQREQLDISFQNVFGMSAGSRTEAYDISHIAGTDAVGAMVVLEDAKPLRKAHRRFITNCSGWRRYRQSSGVSVSQNQTWSCR